MPDLIVTAKGIAGGLPLSAVTGRAEIMDAPHVGGLGGTYGGNPLACAAALAVIETIEADGLVDRARADRQDRCSTGSVPSSSATRGSATSAAAARWSRSSWSSRAPTSPTRPSPSGVAAAAHAQGVIVLTCGTYGNVLRFLPPLAIPDDLLAEALDVLDDGLPGRLMTAASRPRPFAGASTRRRSRSIDRRSPTGTLDDARAAPSTRRPRRSRAGPAPPPRERAEILRRAFELMLRDTDELAALIVRARTASRSPTRAAEVGLRRGVLPLVLRGGRAQRRRLRRRPRRRRPHHRDPPAGRRGRPGDAVELPRRDGHPQDRPGPRRRLHRRAQAGRRDPADRARGRPAS